MKKIITYIAFSALLFSCELKVKEYDEPKNLISQEKMISILEELMIVEDQIQSRHPQFDQFKKTIEKSGDHILKKYNVSFKNFESSFTYYASKQDEMKVIYNKVLENLTKKLNTLQNQ